MDRIKLMVKDKNFIYVILAVLALFFACCIKDYDYDLFARLVVGEYFYNTGWISYKDFLSYTPTHLWYDHEWGASVIFYTFYKLFGNFGLILVQAILMFLTTFFVIKTQRLQNKAYPPSVFFMALFLLLYSHQNPSLVRCHLFSFMFFSMLLYFLEKTRLKNSKVLWLFLPIVIIWNNIHGGVVSGLGIIFVYFIGELISRKPCKKYLLTLLCSFPLLVINPYGFDYLNFLLSANTKNREYVTEWWFVFAKRHVVYYYPLFFVGFFAVLASINEFFNRKKINITKLLVLLVTTILGTIHVKLLSLTVITVFSLYYSEIATYLRKEVVKKLNKICSVIVLLLVLYLPLTKPFIARVSVTKFPVKEVEFLKLNDIKGNIVTEFGLGSYVAYKLYPQVHIYFDGRYEECYYDEEFNNLLHFNLGDEQWDNVVKLYPTQILMPLISIEVYNVIKNDSSWEEVYKGDVCAIFLPKNRQSYKKPFILPSEDIRYYQKNEFEKNS